MKKLDKRGYTLTELLVVMTVLSILCAVTFGVCTRYIERAKTAKAYVTAHLLIQAITVCEAEYGLADGFTRKEMMEKGILVRPNQPDSMLNPYAGADTGDCIQYSVLLRREESGGRTQGEMRYFITGFTYTTEEYKIVWRKTSGLEITNT